MKSTNIGLRAWVRRLIVRNAAVPDEILLAKKLIAAIDAGGVPLNPARVNQIARNLGLEVSRRSAPEETVQRIREALNRHFRH